ncbi:hypothetical protein DXG01_010615 [Tephrocybe rancida]|nr:hypothetical protein DXG01_010615 [Tephrocybe rancida]
MNTESTKRPRSGSNIDTPQATKRLNLNFSPQEVEQLCNAYTLDEIFFDDSSFTADELTHIKNNYVPFFKAVCSRVVGREDVPLRLDSPGDLATYSVIRGAWKRRNLGKLVAFIQQEVKKLDEVPTKSAPTVTPLSVIKAWKTPYVGAAADLLHRAIKTMRISEASKNSYGNFCAIIQGSGTGKSRMVDQLAQSVFTIPVIFRPGDDVTGYPAGDTGKERSLLDYFAVNPKLHSAFKLQRRHLLFLLKAVDCAGEWIDSWRAQNPNHLPEEVAKNWREYLGNPGDPNRLAFYTRTMDDSPLKGFEKILDEEDKEDDDTVAGKADTLMKLVAGKLGSDNPLILFYFDEAHNLTNGAVTTEKTGGSPRTAYQCLCKAFTYLSDAPTFALFLSTYSRLSEFAPSARNFWSYRGDKRGSEDNLHAPFIELPFDIWNGSSLVTEGEHSLAEISSLSFMSRFGRPLFWTTIQHVVPRASRAIENVMDLAMSKLTLHAEGKAQLNIDKIIVSRLGDHILLPTLAIRLDLTFKSNRDEAVYLEGLLVASSMRTAYSVPQHRQYLRGGYSSEPFVAEAAARVIFQHFDDVVSQNAKGRQEPLAWNDRLDKVIACYKEVIPKSTSRWFNTGLVSKGARGELVARMLLTQAHDLYILETLRNRILPTDERISFSRKIPVVDFLRTLISEEYIEMILSAKPQNMNGETLETAFRGAFVYFTQFVKGGDAFIVTDEGCYLMMVRGAAIQGHDTLADIDLIIPICMPSDTHPNRWDMTAIFIQVKNRLRKQSINIDVQKTFKFFTTSDQAKANSRPYITIAMELGVVAPFKCAPQKGKAGKKGKKAPATPPRFHIPTPAQPSPAEIKVKAKPSKHALRGEVNIGHPRYEIYISGCSNKVYQVIDSSGNTYKSLLAHKDLLAEHPRKDHDNLKAVMQMKPYWKESVSYDWATMSAESRLGAPVQKDDQMVVDEAVDKKAADEAAEPEHVFVSPTQVDYDEDDDDEGQEEEEEEV